ncbi:nucleoporin-domain-containing protein [Mucor ambiguus]|uniref:Nucleoporin-domain-containing protein n=1 Tax=Mucor ambiguus TaxID=91626 RepID=A0A0C9LQ18_9FUNG|nr:nucleoporin-domain-containing protein [Mucor ambiguus]
MTTAEPGNEFKAISDASATLESKAAIDRNFPDLHKTFTEHPKYCENASNDYKNVVLKNPIAMSTSVLSDIQQFDQKSPCGFAPLINRAYFVIKNRLCLLDYTKRDIAYIEEEDDIVGVGFAVPKPGIFVDSVKQLLVIATATMIKIIGISNGPDGLKLLNSFLTTLNNGVCMHQIVGTSQGRIFMLGKDDNVWELDYKAKESWFSSRCSKKLQTSGSSLNFLFGKPRDPIVQLAVNESGTILYQLTQNSSIHVVYLGTDGFTYNTAYKKHDCIADAKISQPTSKQFTPETRIVSIHTTTKAESLSYHLVAITSNGSRIYYNNQKDAQQMNYDAEPTGLVTVHVRTPADSVAATDTVSHCLYRNGLMMFVKNPDANPTQSQIVAYSPNLASLGNLALANATAQLIEDGTTLDVHGKVLAMVEAPTGSDDINEFKYAYHTPSRHFLVLTTSGVTLLAKQRPVDMLHNLLLKTGIDTRFRLKEIEPFFNHFGYLNTCSLCFNLICSANLPSSDSLYSNSAIKDPEVQAALEVLRKFGQVSSVLKDFNNRSYSSIHDGLALFIYRTVQDIWGKSLIKETTTSAGISYTNNIASQELKGIKNTVTSVRKNIDQNPGLFHFTADSPETISYNNLLIFLDYLKDSMSFFIYLTETGLDAIIKGISNPASQTRLLRNDIKTLLTTHEGVSTVTSDLPAALIDYTTKRYGDNLEYVIDMLTSQCGSFCRAKDVLIYNAAKQISSAKTANSEQARAILANSFTTLSRIAGSIPCSKAAEFASQYVELGHHVYGILLALDCAQVRDPLNDATAYLDAGCPPDDARQRIFAAKKPFYDIAIDVLKSVLLNPSQPADYRANIMLKAFDPARKDKAFQFYAYDAFLEENIASVLIDIKAPNLEQYLKHSAEYKHYQLLALYYKTSECFDKAAKVYALLSQFQHISPEEKIEYIAKAEMCARAVTSFFF